MLTTIVLALVTAPTLTLEEAKDYFPLNPGDKWVYDQKDEKGSTRVTDTVGEITTIKEKYKVEEEMRVTETVCTPIITTRGGRELDRAYYVISEGEVMIVAFNNKKTLISPLPIVRVPNGSSKWSYIGETVMNGAPADVKYEGSVKRIGKRKFDGKSVDAIEVRLVATMLEAFGTKFTVIQVAVYGKGIGLLSMDMETKLPRRKEKTTRKLLTYTPNTK